MVCEKKDQPLVLSRLSYPYWTQMMILLFVFTVVMGFLYFQEAVGDTLEQLWISYNNIEKLKGIGVLKKLKVSQL